VFDRRIAKEVDADADDTFETAERWVYDGAHIVLAFFDPDGEGTDPSSLATRNLHGPYVD
jgi:hypothetical protein